MKIMMIVLAIMVLGFISLVGDLLAKVIQFVIRLLS